MKRNKRNISLVMLGLLAVFGIVVAGVAFGAPSSSMDMADMADNLNKQIPAVHKFFLGASALIGTFMVGFGLLSLKRLGIANGAAQMSASNPFLLIGIGIALVYFSTAIGIGGNTLFGKQAQPIQIESR